MSVTVQRAHTLKEPLHAQIWAQATALKCHISGTLLYFDAYIVTVLYCMEVIRRALFMLDYKKWTLSLPCLRWDSSQSYWS